jgi:hypothetical protein
MAEQHHRRDRYLTIVSWPEGDGREQAVDALTRAYVSDMATLKLRLRQEPPLIFGGVSESQARDGAAAIRGIGGDAFPCSIQDIAALGATLKIKHLEVREGALDVDLWYGLSTTIRFENIRILIRAQLSSSKESGAGPAPFSPLGGGLQDHNARRLAGAAMMSPAVGMTGAAFMIDEAMSVTGGADKTITTSDKLDIHTPSGVFQIDGDKFGYQVLGSGRGHSDKVNMDRMCELLQHFAPDAIVDEFFSLWKPPVGVDRLRIPDYKKNQDDPAFAFYSRWSALVYRHVLGVR